MDVQELMLIALRASLVYFFLLVVIRLLGKRSVGQGTAFDLLVALMLGEVVDEAIYGDVSLIKAGLAITVIAIWHFVNAWVSYRSKQVDKLLGGEPTVLVKNGEFKKENLAKERINEEEVLSEMRLMQVDKLEEVEEATLEPSGKISVIQAEWAKPLQKGDLPKGNGRKKG